MSEVRQPQQRMSVEEFFAWQRDQDKNYELVDGIPILPSKAMTGATSRHDYVTVNVLTTLRQKLRGKPCRPHTDDLSVINPNGNVRRPDIVVDCLSRPDSAMGAREPTVLVEVLSPSTMAFDRFRKIEEYKTNERIKVVLLIASQSSEVIVWRYRQTGWVSEIFETLEATIPLPEIGCELTLAEIYEDTEVDRA